MLIDILIIVIAAVVLYWLITKFIPAGTAQTVALVIVGVILLLWVLRTYGLDDNRLIGTTVELLV